MKTLNVHYCSMCQYVNQYESTVKSHIKRMACCHDAHVLPYTIEFTLPDGGSSTDAYERKTPGPTPLQMEKILQGRVPAFEMSALDDRIDYFFATEGLVDTCMNSDTGVPDVLALLFRSLWGPDAPVRFQSIVVYKGNVYEVGSTLDINVYNTVRSYMLQGKFLENFLKCVFSICDVINAQRPDLKSHVDDIIEWTLSPKDQLCLMDVFEKNDVYEINRKRETNTIHRARRVYVDLKSAIDMTSMRCSDIARDRV
jgi:hypothetical protein